MTQIAGPSVYITIGILYIAIVYYALKMIYGNKFVACDLSLNIILYLKTFKNTKIGGKRWETVKKILITLYATIYILLKNCEFFKQNFIF